MQESIVNEELDKLDLSKIAALQQKRTLAFVNHFVISTVQFLNNFAKQCETKLMQFERKLEKVEAALVLLETRLASIPEINTVEVKPQEPETKVTEEVSPEANDAAVSVDLPSHNTLISQDTLDTHSDPTPINPEYNRFVKMVQVGVPLQAVKLKMQVEGLDPDLLDKLHNIT